MADSMQRNIQVANRLALILSVLAFVLLIVLVTAFGVNINTPIIFGIALFFLLISFLNRKGLTTTGRVLLCIVPPVITLVAAMLAKAYDPQFTDILYYDSRFFLILFTITPSLIFDTTEGAALYSSLGVILLCLVLFDPIHEFFGLGYYQRGFTGRSYYYINYVALIAWFGLTTGAITMKRAIEKSERLNARIQADLREANRQLQEVLHNLESKNEAMIVQQRQLVASQDQLVEANKLIERQKVDLQKQVHQVNAELQEANEELVKHNNELRQFSYTISHNLRGPIARLLGLASVARLNNNLNGDTEATTIINHIKTSAGELDNVIRDLSAIVDIRNTIYQVRQTVDFAKEWRDVKNLLNIPDDMEARNFRVDFSAAPQVMAVRPMINSILFNLVSNAIKYSAPGRNLQVAVRTRKDQAHTVLEVQDNGLGIDLSLFQNDMFKMYKRFHGHQEGKGLGLYLIKSQAESLNGYVEVNSEPGRGTTFRVFIKNP